MALERGADIAAPVYQGRRGNPVGFSRRHLTQLLGLDGDQGARNLLMRHPVTEVPVDDAGVIRDIDELSDLD
jgi:molybdenum cofactor cytidylyltransferase